MATEVLSFQEQLISDGVSLADPRGFPKQCDFQCIDNSKGNFVLDLKDIIQFTVVGV